MYRRELVALEATFVDEPVHDKHQHDNIIIKLYSFHFM